MIALLLTILVSHPAPAAPVTTLPPAADCTPASLAYLAEMLHLPPHPMTEWRALCGTDAEGSDIPRIAPAWERLEPTTQLLCIYTVEPDDENDTSPFNLQIKALRKEGRYDPDQLTRHGRPYLWIGLHDDMSERGHLHFGPHAAIIYFLGDHIRMVSPNALDSKGLPYVESWAMATFFLHTIAVFDVIDDAEATPLR